MIVNLGNQDLLTVSGERLVLVNRHGVEQFRVHPFYFLTFGLQTCNRFTYDTDGAAPSDDADISITFTVNLCRGPLIYNRLDLVEAFTGVGFMGLRSETGRAALEVLQAGGHVLGTQCAGSAIGEIKLSVIL